MYSVESNSSTVYGEVDGKECAYVMCNALIKQKSERTKVYEKFYVQGMMVKVSGRY